MTRVKVSYMVPKEGTFVDARNYMPEPSTFCDHQIIEYDTTKYSFDGAQLMDPLNLPFSHVFGPDPFTILAKNSTSQIDYRIENESIWGVQPQGPDKDPALFDMHMIVYLNKRI